MGEDGREVLHLVRDDQGGHALSRFTEVSDDYFLALTVDAGGGLV